MTFRDNALRLAAFGLSFLDSRKGLPCCLTDFLAFGGVAVQSPKRNYGRLGCRTDLAQRLGNFLARRPQASLFQGLDQGRYRRRTDFCQSRQSIGPAALILDVLD